jgi:hypothetical protein
MRKMMVAMAMVLAMLCVAPSLGLAAGTWSTANVNSVGVGGSFTYIQLTDTSATPPYSPGTYFAADTTGSRSKEMLATALTAISLSKTVLVWLDDTAAYSNMSCMYLNQ